MKNLQKRGFTLIELLVVVLIIGILAAVAVPQYQKAVAKSRATEAISVLKTLKQAQMAYFLANGDFTDDLSKLDVEIQADSFLGDVTEETANSHKYYYSCHGKTYCSAKIYNEDLPDFEFSNKPDDPYRHYCLAYGKSAKAHDVCKSMGTSDPNAWRPEDYFLLN